MAAQIMGSHIRTNTFPWHPMAPMGYYGVGIGGTSWSLIGFRGIGHGRQRVLDVGSWLESRGPSAGIGTITYIYRVDCLKAVNCVFPASLMYMLDLLSGYASWGPAVMNWAAFNRGGGHMNCCIV